MTNKLTIQTVTCNSPITSVQLGYVPSFVTILDLSSGIMHWTWRIGMASGQAVQVASAPTGLQVTELTTDGVYVQQDGLLTLGAAISQPERQLGVIIARDLFCVDASPDPAPTLGTLALAPAIATEGVPYIGTIAGKTAGSAITLSGAGASGLVVIGTQVSGTPTAAGNVDITETLANAIGSPHLTAGVIVVAAAEPPVEGDVTYNELPTVLTSPLETGTFVSVDPGDVEGDYDTLEIRLQSTASLSAPGTIWLDWTDEPGAVVTADIGDPCYIASRAKKSGVVVETVINTTDFGPWVVYEEKVVFQAAFRGTLAAAAYPADWFIVCSPSETGSATPSGSPSALAAYPTMAAVAGDGSDWADCGGSGIASDRGGPANTGLLTGRFGAATGSFSVMLDNGFYRLRGVLGFGGQTSDPIAGFFDGADNDAKQRLLFESNGTLSKTGTDFYVLSEDGGGAPIITTDTPANIEGTGGGSGWLTSGPTGAGRSGIIEIKNGCLTFKRRSGQSGTTYIVALQIIAVAPPVGGGA